MSLKLTHPNKWRSRLVAASFKGCRFHVEQESRQGGRRVVVHEYPKRDRPYSEDMGRTAIRYHITGYVIGERSNEYNYQTDKHSLIAALEGFDPGFLFGPWQPSNTGTGPQTGYGTLVDPYLPSNDHLGYPIQAQGEIGPTVPNLLMICERYSVSETRERGGYCSFDMVFVEAGEPGNMLQIVDTKAEIDQQATTAADVVATNTDTGLGPDPLGIREIPGWTPQN